MEGKWRSVVVGACESDVAGEVKLSCAARGEPGSLENCCCCSRDDITNDNTMDWRV